MGDGSHWQVAARPETADPRGWNEPGDGAIDTPSVRRRDDKVVGGSEPLIDANIQQALQRLIRRLVVGDESGVCVRGRSRRTLKRPDHLSLAVHRAQSGKITRCMIGEPDQTVGHERRARREGVVRKQFEQIGEPPDSLIPSFRRRERRAIVRRRHQDRAPQRSDVRDRRTDPRAPRGCGGQDRRGNG